MAQYIDKDRIAAEIERRIEENKAEIQRATHKYLEEYFEGYEDALVLFKEKFLDTLEVKEVDLDEEVDNWYNNEASKEFENVLYGDIEKCARYFFELGLRYKSSLASIPNIDDTLKEMGVDPDSKEAKSFKESYYRALDKFKAQKGEQYDRQKNLI